ncbi:MAG: hypothetical protein ACOYD0_08455 [Candidatus Nanopelagicales bacterium]
MVLLGGLGAVAVAAPAQASVDGTAFTFKNDTSKEQFVSVCAAAQNTCNSGLVAPGGVQTMTASGSPIDVTGSILSDKGSVTEFKASNPWARATFVDLDGGDWQTRTSCTPSKGKTEWSPYIEPGQFLQVERKAPISGYKVMTLTLKDGEPRSANEPIEHGVPLATPCWTLTGGSLI